MPHGILALKKESEEISVLWQDSRICFSSSSKRRVCGTLFAIKRIKTSILYNTKNCLQKIVYNKRGRLTLNTFKRTFSVQQRYYIHGRATNTLSPVSFRSRIIMDRIILLGKEFFGDMRLPVRQSEDRKNVEQCMKMKTKTRRGGEGVQKFLMFLCD